MTGCVQLGHHKDVGQGTIVSVHIESQPIQVFMEFFNYHPHEGKTFKLVCWVMEFSLCQTPTSISSYCICAIFVDLVEDSSQARPTGISVELERLDEVCISKNRCSGTQSLQVINGLLAPVIPLNGSLFMLAFSPEVNSCRDWATCMNFLDKLPMICHESQETSDLPDVLGYWPLFDSFYFALIHGYSFGRDHMP